MGSLMIVLGVQVRVHKDIYCIGIGDSWGTIASAIFALPLACALNQFFDGPLL